MDICWLPWSALSAIFEHFRCLVNPTGYPDYKSPLCMKRLQSRKEVSTSQTRWGCYTAPREARGFEIRWLEKSSLSVRPCVRPCVRTPFPYCDFATVHFLYDNRQNRWFLKKTWAAILRLTSTLKINDFGRKYAILRLTSFLKIYDFGRKCQILDENTRFCGSPLFGKSMTLDENTWFWAGENTRFCG